MREVEKEEKKGRRKGDSREGSRKEEEGENKIDYD